MRVILVATLAAGFVLAGCQTTPEDQSAAAVEDRSKPGAKPGADAKSVERPKIAAVDVNPLILSADGAVAVDALVVVEGGSS